MAESIQDLKFIWKGYTRTYRIYVPSNLNKLPLSLVVALHGHSIAEFPATGLGMEQYSQFTDVARARNFMVAYPDGLNGEWEDGRKPDTPISDIGFLNNLVGEIDKNVSPVNRKYVFLVGVGNGGFLTARIAIQEPGTYTGFGIVCATIPRNILRAPFINKPVIIINGDRDPFVPYHGGTVHDPRGAMCLSTSDAADLFATRAGYTIDSHFRSIPNRKLLDGTYITELIYQPFNGADINVKVITVKTGGYAWPGS